MFDELQQLLRDRRKNGETNQAIAKSADTSHQHINRLLNGSPELFAKLQFGTVLKLFPGMIRLEKDGQINQNNSPGAAAAIGGNAISLSGEDVRLFRERVMASVIDDSQICDTCKIKVLKKLKDI